MIRYRVWLLAAALLGGLVFLFAWRSAELAPGVLPAGDGLAVPLDDAAIYFQYARQALQGEWLRYSPGAELSTGVTSPLYFVLLTACMGLGLSGPLTAWLLGLACLLVWLLRKRGITRLPAHKRISMAQGLESVAGWAKKSSRWENRAACRGVAAASGGDGSNSSHRRQNARAPVTALLSLTC